MPDRKIKRKRWNPTLVGGLAVLALFSVVAFYRYASGSSARLRINRAQLHISTVEKGEFRDEIAVVGKVSPRTTVYLDATEGGRVEKVHMEAGSTVAAGEEIVSLDNNALRLDVMYREAQFFEQINNLHMARLEMEHNQLELEVEKLGAKAKFERQERLYQRSRKLFEEALISIEEFEDVQTEHEYLAKRYQLADKTERQDSEFRQIQIQQLEAAVTRMQANLKILKQKLQSLTVRAPVAGHLTSLDVQVGESKPPGARLGQIDVLDGVKIAAFIDEHYLRQVDVGHFASFDLAGVEQHLTVEKVYPEVSSGKFEVDLRFLNEPPDDIRRGQTVHLRLAVGESTESAVLLGRGGFVQETGGQWAFVVDPQGSEATKRKIQVGRQNPRVFEILQGLEPGEKVITSSYSGFATYDKLLLRD